MSKELFHVDIPEDCFICGSGMVLYTEHNQKCECPEPDTCKRHDGYWWAYDGETVQCPDCGALAWVCADGGVWVSYDEETEHNIRCSELYNARESNKRGAAE